MRPLFTVIVPTRDRPQLLARAIQSLLAQTLIDFECVVVDDAGAEPAEVPQDPRFRLIRQSTCGGPAAARNAGLRVARGRFVAFLDDDDEYTPVRLDIGRDGLRRALVNVCWRTETRSGVDRRWDEVLEGRVAARAVAGPIPHLGQCSLASSIAPSFDETLPASEDVDWWIRLATLDPPLSTEGRVGYIQHDHDGARRSEDQHARLQARAHLIKAHDPFFRNHHDAAAYQWKRLGGIASSVGDRHLARLSFRRSFLARPSPRTLVRMVMA